MTISGLNGNIKFLGLVAQISLRLLLVCYKNGFRDGFPKDGRDGIANLHVLFSRTPLKLKKVWKTLQPCGLAHRE